MVSFEAANVELDPNRQRPQEYAERGNQNCGPDASHTATLVRDKDRLWFRLLHKALYDKPGYQSPLLGNCRMGLQEGFGLAIVFLWAEEDGQTTFSKQAIDHRTSRHEILGG